MEQNPYLRDNSFSASQKLPHTLENLKAYYHVHASQTYIVQSMKLSIQHLKTIHCTAAQYYITDKLSLLKAQFDDKFE
jgi:hypothetical protein